MTDQHFLACTGVRVRGSVRQPTKIQDQRVTVTNVDESHVEIRIDDPTGKDDSLWIDIRLPLAFVHAMSDRMSQADAGTVAGRNRNDVITGYPPPLRSHMKYIVFCFVMAVISLVMGSMLAVINEAVSALIWGVGGGIWISQFVYGLTDRMCAARVPTEAPNEPTQTCPVCTAPMRLLSSSDSDTDLALHAANDQPRYMCDDCGWCVTSDDSDSDPPDTDLHNGDEYGRHD